MNDRELYELLLEGHRSIKVNKNIDDDYVICKYDLKDPLNSSYYYSKDYCDYYKVDTGVTMSDEVKFTKRDVIAMIEGEYCLKLCPYVDSCDAGKRAGLCLTDMIKDKMDEEPI